MFSYCETPTHRLVIRDRKREDSYLKEYESRMEDGEDRDLGELCRRLRSLLQEDTPGGGLLQVI